MTAQAVTEHGNVSSHPQHEKACRKVGIKPLFGLEAYFQPEPKTQRKFHLTILAENQEGYANLNRIVSRSWAEKFYYWPTVDGAMLRDHSEGLVVLSGCADSMLSCSLLGGKTIPEEEASLRRAERVASQFKSIFGDRFYLETQMFPELERTRTLNPAFEDMGARLGIPLAATADVHYPQPNDNEIQVILHAAHRGNNTVARQMEGWEYDIRLTHPTSDRLVIDRLRATGLSLAGAREAARSTVEIADRCNVILPKAELLRFPVEQVMPGATSEELIWAWMREGWSYRVRQGNQRMVKHAAEYKDRIDREMGDIKAKDFIDYFVMTADATRFAKEAGVLVGPARGSAAASLVCYLLRITEIDPMEYPLMYFERFIDPTRTDIPDIDLDFASNRRHEIRTFLEGRYGAGSVGNLANYVRYRGRNSIDDVARVHEVPKFEAETVKGMLIERSGGDSRADFTLADTVEMFPVVKDVFERYPALWKAADLEGDYRGLNVHAAGLVVTNAHLDEITASYAKEVRGHPVTVVAVDKYDAEYLGLLKVDFLGLSTMEMLGAALDLAGLTLEDLYRIKMDDEKVMEAFRRNDVIGVFQWEGRATRLVNRDVKPNDFMELAAVNAMSRPGPLFSGTTGDYINVKFGRAEKKHFHPIIDELTKATNGEIIYQEQILKILEIIGGLPVEEVHEIRKIISKKLGEAKFNESADSFAAGAARLHGIDRDTAHKIWGRLVTAATYAFNVAHCVSYSMIAFWCMWFKVYHPAPFYAAALRNASGGANSEATLHALLKDAGRHGISVIPLDPARSEADWSVTPEGSVLAGWLQVPGVGAVTADRIVAHAREKPIKGFEDLLEVRGIGSKTIQSFRTFAEAEDPFGVDKIANALAEVRKSIRSGEIPLPMPDMNSDGILEAEGGTSLRWMGVPGRKEYKDIFEDERARSGKSVEEIRASIDRPDLPTSCVIHCKDDGDEDVYVRVTRFNYPKFKAAIERLRLGTDVLYVEARKSKGGFGASLYVQQMFVINPE